jgi:hypothetical protein
MPHGGYTVPNSMIWHAQSTYRAPLLHHPFARHALQKWLTWETCGFSSDRIFSDRSFETSRQTQTDACARACTLWYATALEHARTLPSAYPECPCARGPDPVPEPPSVALNLPLCVHRFPFHHDQVRSTSPIRGAVAQPRPTYACNGLGALPLASYS